MNKGRMLAKAMITMLAVIILIEVNAYYHKGEQALAGSTPYISDKAVVILLDYTLLEDFRNYPNLSRLADKSSLALISNRLSGNPTLHKSRITYGAGGLIDVDAGMLNAGNAQNAGKIFFSYTGIEPDDNNITYTDINSLINKNKAGNYNQIGYIGDILNKAGKKTFAAGNSDADRPDRSAVFIAMDSSGLVDYGDIDNTLIIDEDFPGGKRTDYNKLVELYKQFLPACSLFVIDTGDLCRLEHYKKYMNESQCLTYRRESLERIDGLIGSILDINGTDSKISIYILSSYPAQVDGKSNRRMTPLMVYDEGTGGFFRSMGTKRTGIISNVDFADLLLYKLGCSTSSKVYQVAYEHAYDYLKKSEAFTIAVAENRPPTLKVYALFVIFILMSALLIFINNKYSKAGIPVRVIKQSLMIILLLPLVFLYSPMVSKYHTIQFITLNLSLAILLSIMVSSVIEGFLEQFIIISFTTAIGLIADVLCGSAFIKQSVLGYDPILGARFYGIGNEFAGIFIGCTLIFIGCLLELCKKCSFIRLLKIHQLWLMLFFTAVISLPFWGANLGGTIAALTGYFIMYILVNEVRLGYKTVMLMLILTISVTALITAIDLSNSSYTTHVGRLAMEIRQEGIRPLYMVAVRKLAMNMKLIRYTVWTKVLLCIIAVVIVLFFKPIGLLRGVFKNYGYIEKSWISISAASIIGLAVNDSGIVLAATATIYIGCTLLYVCLNEVNCS